MEKNIYIAFFKQDENKGAILGMTFSQEQAFALAQKFLGDNPSVKCSQVIVKIYEYKKDLQIIDTEEK